jgi:hypothetical protein
LSEAKERSHWDREIVLFYKKDRASYEPASVEAYASLAKRLVVEVRERGNKEFHLLDSSSMQTVTGANGLRLSLDIWQQPGEAKTIRVRSVASESVGSRVAWFQGDVNVEGRTNSFFRDGRWDNKTLYGNATELYADAFRKLGDRLAAQPLLEGYPTSSGYLVLDEPKWILKRTRIVWRRPAASK